MSSNLRNKKFMFRNQQCTEEEYQRKLSSIGKDWKTLNGLYIEYVHMKRSALHKHANMIKCTNSSGNNLTHCKNAASVLILIAVKM